MALFGLNNRLIVMVVMLDILLFLVGGLIPSDISTSSITGLNNNTLILNNTAPSNSYSDIEITGFNNIFEFILFLFSFGLISISGMPLIFSIPIGMFLTLLNILVLVNIISWVRELIGLT